MTERQKISPHPLDGCNDEDCYRTMMAERTVLIAAQREAQDTLIKTIIQLSSALIALMAGFITQAKFALTDTNLFVFSAAVLSFAASIVFGLMENFFGSKAYKEQQVMLEDYYGKYIGEFAEAKWNKWVHRAQLGAFLFFVIALLSLAIFGLLEAKGKSDVKQSTVTTSSPTTTTTTISTIQRGNIREQPTNQVSSSDNATSSAEKEMIEARLTSPCGKPYFAHNYCYCAPNSCSTISLIRASQRISKDLVQVASGAIAKRILRYKNVPVGQQLFLGHIPELMANKRRGVDLLPLEMIAGADLDD